MNFHLLDHPFGPLESFKCLIFLDVFPYEHINVDPKRGYRTPSMRRARRMH